MSGRSLNVCLNAYKNTPFGKIVYRRGEGIFNVHGPSSDRSEAIAEQGRNDNVYHEMSEKGQALDGTLPVKLLQRLKRI